MRLRTCQSCGVTLCCDSFPNKYATTHFRETNHPVMSSAESGEQ
ncbi:MAG: UBP-type zinc finger domain-containing protein [Bacteroidota bacterium]